MYVTFGNSFIRVVEKNEQSTLVKRAILSMQKYMNAHGRKDRMDFYGPQIHGFETFLYIGTSSRIYLLVCMEDKWKLFQTYLILSSSHVGDLHHGWLTINDRDEYILYLDSVVVVKNDFHASTWPIPLQYNYIYNMLKNDYEYDRNINPFHIRTFPLLPNTELCRNFIDSRFSS